MDHGVAHLSQKCTAKLTHSLGRSQAPKVSVVVLNWCGEEDTRACLESVLQSEYPALNVVLVDNGSPDGSGERLQCDYPNLDFIQIEENCGYTGGNNRGIQFAIDRGDDYVLVLNNDTEIDRLCIKFLVEAATERDDVGGVTSKILYHHDPARIWYGGGHFSPLHGLGIHWLEGESDVRSGVDVPREVSFMSGCCLLLSCRALREVGGFVDELFAYVEDAELCLRLSRSGYRMLYQPNARVLHHSRPAGEPPTPFQIRQRDRNRRWVMRRYFGPRHLIPFFVRFYASRSLLVVRYLAVGDWGRARAIVQGSFGGIGP